MATFAIIFEFSDDDGILTASEALADHAQIVSLLSENDAIQLCPTAFLMEADTAEDELVSTLTPFIDRSERVYVFEVDLTSWSGVTAVDIIKSIDNLESRSDD